jgi:hypothetical protein
MRNLHGIVVRLETVLEGLRHLLLVLDDKDVHVPFIGADRSPPQLTKS